MTLDPKTLRIVYRSWRFQVNGVEAPPGSPHQKSSRPPSNSLRFSPLAANTAPFPSRDDSCPNLCGDCTATSLPHSSLLTRSAEKRWHRQQQPTETCST